MGTCTFQKNCAGTHSMCTNSETYPKINLCSLRLRLPFVSHKLSVVFSYSGPIYQCCKLLHNSLILKDLVSLGELHALLVVGLHNGVHVALELLLGLARGHRGGHRASLLGRPGGELQQRAGARLVEQLLHHAQGLDVQGLVHGVAGHCQGRADGLLQLGGQLLGVVTGDAGLIHQVLDLGGHVHEEHTHVDLLGHIHHLLHGDQTRHVCVFHVDEVQHDSFELALVALEDLIHQRVLDGGGADEDQVAVEADDLHSLEGDGARDGLGLERISQVFEQHGQRHAEAAQQANFRVKHEGEDEGHEHDEEVLLGQLPSHPKLVKVDEAEHSDHHHSSESRLRDVVEGIGQGAERNEHNHQGHGLGQGSLGTAVGVQRGAGEGAGHGVTGSDGVGEVAQSQGHKLLTGVQDRQLTACGGGLSGHGVALHVRDDGQGDHVQEHLAQGELKLGRAKDVQARRHLTHHLQVVAVVGIVVLEDLPGLVRGDDQAQQRGERGEEVVGLVSPGLLGLVGELVVSLENVEAEQRDVDAEGDVHGMNIDPAVTLAG
eukprot:Colp12_sorted_trinity150504_noHs@11513